VITFVVDVSLSPAWVEVFAKLAWPAVHWSTVGDPRATDRVVMAWAREHRHVVFTHDLDFTSVRRRLRARFSCSIDLIAKIFVETLSQRASAKLRSRIYRRS
jgi:predicted nuclease of predicted toxin-antitoxin system